MELVRWNPTKDLFSLHNRFNRFFDDMFYPSRFAADEASMWSWHPVMDVYEDDGHVVIKAELPGIDKKDISVDVKGRILTLKGERSAENEVKEDNYYRRERSFGRFERSFTLPDDVDPDKIEAEYKDGVLKLKVPKPETKKPRQITIH